MYQTCLALSPSYIIPLWWEKSYPLSTLLKKHLRKKVRVGSLKKLTHVVQVAIVHLTPKIRPESCLRRLVFHFYLWGLWRICVGSWVSHGIHTPCVTPRIRMRRTVDASSQRHLRTGQKTLPTRCRDIETTSQSSR